MMLLILRFNFFNYCYFRQFKLLINKKLPLVLGKWEFLLDIPKTYCLTNFPILIVLTLFNTLKV